MPIGGFFELDRLAGSVDFHSKATGLSNGRTCLNLILQQYKPSNVYVPFYCCDTLLLPFQINEGIKYSFYALNEKLEPASLPILEKDELFIYINYFGIKANYARYLAAYYKEQAIVDNTHGYFEKEYRYGWSFNSSRKFFGVPDGAYLYGNSNTGTEYHRNHNFITKHLILRLDGRQADAFEFYKKNEEMQNCELSRISVFSEKILQTIDYKLVANRRRANYNFFHQLLNAKNQLTGIELDNDTVPFCYPFLSAKNVDLSLFYNKSIFIPVLWKEVMERTAGAFNLERNICSKLLPLPVDHRYDGNDLLAVVDMINDANAV